MLDMTQAAPPDFRRTMRPALIVGVLGVVLTAVGAFLAPAQFFRSYLVAYIFFIGLALGCLAFAMLHYLAGGAWSAVLRRVLEAAMRTLPLMALLAIPFLFGMPYLYEWAHPEVVAQDALLQWKQPYLNVPFFWIRAVIYMAVWLILLYFFNRWTNEQDRTGEARWADKMRSLAAPGLILLAITVTFGAFDWLMSLEPHWFSHIYGALLAMSAMLGALAFGTLVLALASQYDHLNEVITPRILSDLGSLILAFTMIWAYFAFSQYLLIWYANLQEEVPWYLRRLEGGWQILAAADVFLGFALPFLLMMGGDVKRRARPLAIAAGFVLFMRLVDLYWMVAPAFVEHLQVHWLDIAALVGVGGIWVWFFLRQLQRRPILAYNDPKLPAPVVDGHTAH